MCLLCTWLKHHIITWQYYYSVQWFISFHSVFSLSYGGTLHTTCCLVSFIRIVSSSIMHHAWCFISVSLLSHTSSPYNSSSLSMLPFAWFPNIFEVFLHWHNLILPPHGIAWLEVSGKHIVPQTFIDYPAVMGTWWNENRMCLVCTCWLSQGCIFTLKIPTVSPCTQVAICHVSGFRITHI